MGWLWVSLGVGLVTGVLLWILGGDGYPVIGDVGIVLLISALLGLALATITVLSGGCLPDAFGAYEKELINPQIYNLQEIEEDKYIGLDLEKELYNYIYKEKEKVILGNCEQDNTELIFDEKETPCIEKYQVRYKNDFVDWMFGVMVWETPTYKIIIPNEEAITYSYIAR